MKSMRRALIEGSVRIARPLWGTRSCQHPRGKAVRLTDRRRLLASQLVRVLGRVGWRRCLGLLLTALSVAGQEELKLGPDRVRHELLIVDRIPSERVASLPPSHGRVPAIEGKKEPLPSWRTEARQAIQGPEPDACFGHTVAGAGDWNGDGYADVAVGGFRLGSNRRGGVLIYFGSRQGLSPTNRFRIDCPANLWSEADPIDIRGVRYDGAIEDVDFGHQVESAGDVDGDGVDDLIVGATHYSVEQAGQGAAFLYFGSRAAYSSRPSWKYRGRGRYSRFGFSVAAAGDVNGDGFADVLVGAPHQKSPGMGARAVQGCAYLFLGSRQGLSQEPAWTATGEQETSQFSYSLHGAGDVNRDGFDDVLIGDRVFLGEAPLVGKVYLFLGRCDGLAPAPAWTAEGRVDGQEMGNSVFWAGDVNRDGFSDVVIGANGTTRDLQHEGMIQVFLGSPEGLALEPAWQFRPRQSRAHFGHSVATAGDVNGDGFSDLVASSFYGGQDLTGEGFVLVFHGSAAGISPWPDWSARGGAFQSGYGATVRSAGDVDGDGFDDLLIGQPFHKQGETEMGRLWIHFGSEIGLEGSSGWRAAFSESGVDWARRRLLRDAGPRFLVALGGCTLVSLAAAVLGIRWFQSRPQRRATELETARQSAIRAERERLAQDLHDSVGPHLARLAQAVSVPDGASRAAHEVVRALEQAVWAVDPEHDTLESLVSFLGLQAEQFFSGTSTRCLFDLPEISPDVHLAPDVRKNVVLSVREAFTNVLKHAGASEVSLRVAFTPRDLVIRVEDNGRGIRFGGASSGRGLKNLRIRMEALGGGLAVGGRPGGGTQLSLQVPLGR